MTDRNGTTAMTTAGDSKQVIVADVVNVPAGEVEVVRDEKGRITRLRRHGIAGTIAVVPSMYEGREPPPIERPMLPAPLARPVKTPLDRRRLWAPAEEARRVYEACVARVVACGIVLPPYEMHWASASPLNPPHAHGYPRGLVQLHAGRLRLIVNVRSDRLERTILHELGHLCDLPRYAAMCSPEELEGDEVRQELDRRADEFVTWILATPPPPPPEPYRSPHNERRWYF